MFSVVIPLYNKEKSIPNTIQSVLDQTFQKFEMVVVNDGSTDQSLKQVLAFKDSRIRVINKENGGVSSARNRGIKEAKYDWVAFLDGDDFWESNHLKEIAQMMGIYPSEKVYVTSFEYSDKRRMFKHPRHESVIKIQDYFNEAIEESLIWTSIVVVDKQSLIDLGGFNIKLIRGEDKDVWARLAKNYNIVKSQKVTACYRIEAENRSDNFVDVRQTFEGVIDLYSSDKKNEYKYYKNLVVQKLKACLVRKEFLNVYYLLAKHNFKVLIPNYWFSKN